MDNPNYLQMFIKDQGKKLGHWILLDPNYTNN
jgi:hypothetical protein